MLCAQSASIGVDPRTVVRSLPDVAARQICAPAAIAKRRHSTLYSLSCINSIMSAMIRPKPLRGTDPVGFPLRGSGERTSADTQTSCKNTARDCWYPLNLLMLVLLASERADFDKRSIEGMISVDHEQY